MRQKTRVPERGDLFWLDFEPALRREIGKYRPALILSDKKYNQKTGVVICSPLSTGVRGEGTEVPVHNLDKPSVVASGHVATLSWKGRRARFIKKAEQEVYFRTVTNIISLIGADKVVEQFIEDGQE